MGNIFRCKFEAGDVPFSMGTVGKFGIMVGSLLTTEVAESTEFNAPI